jgi:siroheme synthase-like protein
MSSYYPVFLDLKGRRCLVVGGGSVAERKTRMLLEHDALVTVISPALNQGLQQLAEQGAIQVVPRNFKSNDLRGAFLAIAATDDPITNAAVSDKGRKQRILINVVDDPKVSDFIVPSIVRRGDITIAISTAGKSPALARKIRTELDAILPAQYARLLSLVSDVREELAQRQISVDSEKWQRSLKIDVLLEMIGKGQIDQARKKLIEDLIAKDN